MTFTQDEPTTGVVTMKAETPDTVMQPSGRDNHPPAGRKRLARAVATVVASAAINMIAGATPAQALNGQVGEINWSADEHGGRHAGARTVDVAKIVLAPFGQGRGSQSREAPQKTAGGGSPHAEPSGVDVVFRGVVAHKPHSTLYVLVGIDKGKVGP